MDVAIDVSKTVLTTERLVLRPLEPDDAEDLYAYASVPGVGEMAGWKHHESIDESRAILRMLTAEKEVLAITHRADRRMIGTIGLHRSWANDEEAYRQCRVREIGYVLSKAYWGQGLMPEAVSAVIRYGFDTLGLDALTCGHFAQNSQSRRVIEKCGFQYVDQKPYVAPQLQQTFMEKRYILLNEPTA